MEAAIHKLQTNGTAVVQVPGADLPHEFIVPEIPGGYTDEPLDLGALQLQPVEPLK